MTNEWMSRFYLVQVNPSKDSFVMPREFELSHRRETDIVSPDRGSKRYLLERNREKEREREGERTAEKKREDRVSRIRAGNNLLCCACGSARFLYIVDRM